MKKLITELNQLKANLQDLKQLNLTFTSVPSMLNPTLNTLI